MTVHHWPPRPALSRAKARADVNRMLDMLDGMGVSRSVHPMQQQTGREDMVEYYARRAREAQAQADARKGEVYDDDLDTWRQGDPGDECSCAICGREPLSCPGCALKADHVPQMVRELEGDDVVEALCGPMGRTA